MVRASVNKAKRMKQFEDSAMLMLRMKDEWMLSAGSHREHCGITCSGTPLHAIIVGGGSLKSLFDYIANEIFINVVADGVHLSLFVSHARISYKKGPEEKIIANHNTSHWFTVHCFTALDRPENHTEMIASPILTWSETSMKSVSNLRL